MNAPILRLTAWPTAAAAAASCRPGADAKSCRHAGGGAPSPICWSAPRPATTPRSGGFNDEQALVATTDFFMPIVDDPVRLRPDRRDQRPVRRLRHGRPPILALAIVGMPVKSCPRAMIRAILAGGAAVCAEAGIPVAGGHSIDSAEPIYGLAVVGLVSTRRC